MGIKHFVLGFVCVLLTFASAYAGKSESSISSPRMKKHSEIILSPESKLLAACLAYEVDLIQVVDLLEKGANPLVGFKPLEKTSDHKEPLPFAEIKPKKKQGLTGKIFSGRPKKKHSQSIEFEPLETHMSRPLVVTNMWDFIDTIPNQSTPLHIAALRNMPKLAEYLMNYKTKQVYSKDSDGNTPLHVAIISNSREVFDVIMAQPEQFQERKQYLWAQQKSFTIFNKNNRNLLHVAIINGGAHAFHFVEKLVLAGINLNWATKGLAGRTPYELAIQHQMFKIALLLAINGAQVPANQTISGKVDAQKMNQLLFSSEALKLQNLLHNDKEEFLEWLNMQDEIDGQFLLDYDQYRKFGERIQKPVVISLPKAENNQEVMIKPDKLQVRAGVKSLPAPSPNRKRAAPNRFLFNE